MTHPVVTAISSISSSLQSILSSSSKNPSKYNMSQAINKKFKGVEILTTYKSEMNLGLLDLDISILLLCIPGLFDCSALKNPLEAWRPPLNLNVNTCGRRMLAFPACLPENLVGCSARRDSGAPRCDQRANLPSSITATRKLACTSIPTHYQRNPPPPPPANAHLA